MNEPEALDELSPAEQILHVQELWDRIAAKPDDVPVTPAQRAELRRRLDRHLADPEAGTPWEELRDRLLTRRGGS